MADEIDEYQLENIGRTNDAGCSSRLRLNAFGKTRAIRLPT